MTASLTIAIDGPAAAGKSTVSKALAAQLGLTLVDTGALYRSVAFHAHRCGVDWDDEAALSDIARDLDVSFRFDGKVNRVFLGADEVSDAIRTPEMSEGASRVSALPAVRASLMELQRTLASRPPGAVLEGRDIGTVVLPGATAKFFLTASPETRARRRFDEMVIKGESPVFEDVLAAEVERDRRDTDRAVAPLKQADDAILVDSTGLDAQGVIDLMIDQIRQRAPRFFDAQEL